MIDLTDRRTDGQTDTSLMHRRLTLKAASINKYLRQKLQKKVFISTQQNEHRPVYTSEVE